MKSGILRKSIDMYIICCIGCRATENLEMVAHRADDGLMVGWIFVCPQCCSKFYNNDVVVGEIAADFCNLINFLDTLGDIAKGDTLTSRVTKVVTYYANQTGRWWQRSVTARAVKRAVGSKKGSIREPGREYGR